jgi:hypothetical protein
MFHFQVPSLKRTPISPIINHIITYRVFRWYFVPLTPETTACAIRKALFESINRSFSASSGVTKLNRMFFSWKH